MMEVMDAAKPKHTLKNLLGLDNKRFLEFKKTEKWVQKRSQENDYSEKEKHVDFAKELF